MCSGGVLGVVCERNWWLCPWMRAKNLCYLQSNRVLRDLDIFDISRIFR